MRVRQQIDFAGFANDPMGVTPMAQTGVASPGIGLDLCPRRDHLLQGALQTARRSVGHAPEPNPAHFSPATSAAITTTLLPAAPRPNVPAASPPMNVSSTSTTPLSRSRPGRTMARLSLCSQLHAVR